MKNRKLFALGLVLILTLSLFAGCSGSQNKNNQPSQPSDSTDPAQPARTDLTIASAMSITGIDPLNPGAAVDQNVKLCIFEPLYFVPTVGEAIPLVAESHEVSEDNLVWTFHIREGITFHNGDPLTAEDVLFTYETFRDMQMFIWMINNLESMEAVDEHTFVIRLIAPQPDLLDQQISAPIVPKKYYTEAGPEKFATEPVGSGPYKFVSMDMNDRVVMTANENYWGEAPAIKDVTYRYMSDQSACAVALEAGTIQLTTNISVADFDYLDGLENVEIGTCDSGVVHDLIVFNVNVAPFDDVNVRRAISYATNRAMVIDAVYGGHAVEIGSVVPPASAAYDETLAGYPYDLEKAAACLAESGYSKDSGLTLDIYCSSAMGNTISTILQGSLQEIGVGLNINMMDTASFNQKVFTGDVGMLVTAGGPTSMNGYSLAEFSSGMFAQYYSHYHNEEIDALFAKAQGTNDEDERTGYYKEAMRLLTDDAVYDVVDHRTYVYGASSDLNCDLAKEINYGGLFTPYFLSYK